MNKEKIKKFLESIDVYDFSDAMGAAVAVFMGVMFFVAALSLAIALIGPIALVIVAIPVSIAGTIVFMAIKAFGDK